MQKTGGGREREGGGGRQSQSLHIPQCLKQHGGPEEPQSDVVSSKLKKN